MKGTKRGKLIEKILAETEYKDWYNIGASDRGYFPVIDFQKGKQVVSLKTIDPTLSSYSGSKATEKIEKYIEALNRKILVDGVEAEKILDVRIPEGTRDLFDIDELNRYAENIQVILKIEEFK